MFEWLKSLLKPRVQEVEYERPAEEGQGPLLVPASPPVAPHVPAAPVNDPAPEDSEQQR